MLAAAGNCLLDGVVSCPSSIATSREAMNDPATHTGELDSEISKSSSIRAGACWIQTGGVAEYMLVGRVQRAELPSEDFVVHRAQEALVPAQRQNPPATRDRCSVHRGTHA